MKEEIMKRALITGINGQDGSYLAELLLEKGYAVHGIVRRKSVVEETSTRIQHLLDNPELPIYVHYADLLDKDSLKNVVCTVKPDEIYNLAAQSHVGISFSHAELTVNTNAMGVLFLLDIMKEYCPKAKFYQASSSELFGNEIDDDGHQRETTPMRPVSPYGCAKLFAHNICNHYRFAYDMFICCGILHNHESSRRGSNFVTQKIVKNAVQISLGIKKDKLKLGNLFPRRDWGHAKDYVKAMWLMLQQDEPDDYVVSSIESHTIEEFCQIVFTYLKMDYKKHIETDPSLVRPHEVVDIKGDSTKAREVLGWTPEYDFNGLIEDMIEHELAKYSDSERMAGTFSKE